MERVFSVFCTRDIAEVCVTRVLGSELVLSRFGSFAYVAFVRCFRGWFVRVCRDRDVVTFLSFTFVAFVRCFLEWFVRVCHVRTTLSRFFGDGIAPLTVPTNCITGSGTTAISVPMFTSLTVPVYVRLFVCLGVTVLPLLPATVFRHYYLSGVINHNSLLKANKQTSSHHPRALSMVGRKHHIVPFASKPEVTKRLH